MIRSRLFSLLTFLAMLVVFFGASTAHSRSIAENDTGQTVPEAPLRVVASFSILGDLVHVLGGPHVEVITLVGPDSDGHTYQPTPADSRKLARADLVVSNGLHFEGWIPRLVQSAGYRGLVIVATKEVDIMYLNGEPDPHAWQSLDNILIYADNITQALVQMLPASTVDLQHRNRQFHANVTDLQQTARTLFNAIPAAQRKVVTSHDAFGYFGRDYAIQFIAPVGVSTDAQASAIDVAQLIRQIKLENIRAVFVENISDPRLITQIGRETGISIGGSLYSDALSSPPGPAPTYLAMMHHNITLIADALGQTTERKRH